MTTVRRFARSTGRSPHISPKPVLTAEYASLIAMEFGRNPIVNDEAAFDIYPPYELSFEPHQAAD
jgi:translation initiation factor IF-2